MCAGDVVSFQPYILGLQRLLPKQKRRLLRRKHDPTPLPNSTRILPLRFILLAFPALSTTESEIFLWRDGEERTGGGLYVYEAGLCEGEGCGCEEVGGC